MSIHKTRLTINLECRCYLFPFRNIMDEVTREQILSMILARTMLAEALRLQLSEQEIQDVFNYRLMRGDGTKRRKPTGSNQQELRLPAFTGYGYPRPFALRSRFHAVLLHEPFAQADTH